MYNEEKSAEPITISIGHNLQRMRNAIKISQTTLCEDLEDLYGFRVARASYSAYELNTYLPNVALIPILQRYYRQIHHKDYTYDDFFKDCMEDADHGSDTE